MIVELSPEDMALAKEIASKRDGQKKGYSSSAYWNKSSHYCGILGEIAYARHYGVPVDSNLDPLGDDGFDLRILGLSIDVKTTKYSPPILKINSMDDMKSDMLALALVQGGCFIELCGFCDRERLKSRGYKHDFGYGERLCINQSDLFF